MNERQFYTIKGSRWYQAPITYEELGSIGKLIPSFNEMFKKDGVRFGDVAQSIYDAGLVPRLFRLILKPDHHGSLPTPINFLLNWFFRLTGNVRRKNLARTMTLEEIFGVIADFFFINTSGIERLMNSEDTSGSRMKGLIMMQAMLGIPLPLPTSLSSSQPGMPQESKQPSDSSAPPAPSQ